MRLAIDYLLFPKNIKGVQDDQREKKQLRIKDLQLPCLEIP